MRFHLYNSATCETPTESKSHQRKLSSYALPTLTQVSESDFPNTNQNLRYDVPLPSQDKLIAMDIDEQLRYLALKEMCIVELKDNINNLNNKLKHHNKELHKLREIIQRSLYKELSSENTATKIINCKTTDQDKTAILEMRQLQGQEQEDGHHYFRTVERAT